MKRLKSVLACCVAVLAAFGWSQAPAPDFKPELQKSWPAGPYSSVSTSFGTLETVVPLVQVKGVGGSGLSLSIMHRQNVIPSTLYALENGAAGCGWSNSYTQTLIVTDSPNGGTIGSDYYGDVQVMNGNLGGERWHLIADVFSGAVSFDPRPGTREDLARVPPNFSCPSKSMSSPPEER